VAAGAVELFRVFNPGLALGGPNVGAACWREGVCIAREEDQAGAAGVAGVGAVAAVADVRGLRPGGSVDAGAAGAGVVAVDKFRVGVGVNVLCGAVERLLPWMINGSARFGRCGVAVAAGEIGVFELATVGVSDARICVICRFWSRYAALGTTVWDVAAEGVPAGEVLVISRVGRTVVDVRLGWVIRGL